jgi:hypothetical protein
MAHFAELNTKKIVKQVIVVNNESLDPANEEESGLDFLESLFGHRSWKQTSYSGSFRKNFAGVGFKYDSAKDAFVSPQPYPSWVLDQTTCQWNAPVEYPNDGEVYFWNEELTIWELQDFSQNEM